MIEIDEQIERKNIINDYRQLMKIVDKRISDDQKKEVRKAFEMALEAHKEMRRKSGEPYIHHPIAVAKIVASEIGLGATSIICALIHDTVEDTEVTLEDIQKEFGNTVSGIIDGLTKIDKIATTSESIQAENYRKIIFTLGDDIRVTLIKLADRLHNMRTLSSMKRHKQLKVASETSFLYAPLAHRLGLYAVKSELEDLSMKYMETEKYKEIARKLNQKKKERTKFINDFCLPLQKQMDDAGLKARVFGRPKTIFSIWRKMKQKQVEFEEVYDLFAIRVVLDSPLHMEKEDCWRAYSIVAARYKPNPNRLRDWISNPKSNGYESLHTTVMGSNGKWVEVQIRTERMDEVAEKGLAAHWKYKEGSTSSKIDEAFESWLAQVRDLLKNPETNPLEFINDFKLQLYSKEMYVFTPKGHIKNLPKGSTALDFAFSIHTDIGSHCIGAKVNSKLVPISHILTNGDQVEIITSGKQKPNEDWLSFVVTSRAISKIKSALKEEKKKQAEDGKVILKRKMKQTKATFDERNVQMLTNYFKMQSTLEFYYNIALGKIDLAKLKALNLVGGYYEEHKVEQKKKSNFEVKAKILQPKIDKDAELILFGESSDKFAFEFAKCCAPIPGDDVLGFITVNGVVKIHRENCPNAVHMMSKYGYRVIKTKWNDRKSLSFLSEITLNGIDDIGLINKITNIISKEHKINMKSLAIESNDGVFEGAIKVFVKDNEELNSLVKRLKKIKGILNVKRIEKQE